MKELKDYPIQMEIPVRWADMDAFQHVNNAVYLKWVECARIEYISKFLTGKLDNLNLGPILARQDIRYIFPLRYPDTVCIGFKVQEIQDDRLLCESRIYSKKYEKLCAISYNTVMAYDFVNLRKSDIPVDWVMKIQDVEE